MVRSQRQPGMKYVQHFALQGPAAQNHIVLMATLTLVGFLFCFATEKLVSLPLSFSPPPLNLFSPPHSESEKFLLNLLTLFLPTS